MRSPTALTLKFLRDCGHVAEVVERFNHHVQRKHDFAGFADVLAFRPSEPGVLAIQATTRAHVKDRLGRIRKLPSLSTWLNSANRAEVWGWYKTPAGRWEVERVSIRPDDLEAALLTAPRIRRGRKGERQRNLFDGG
jgi:hypothetical protein